MTNIWTIVFSFLFGLVFIIIVAYFASFNSNSGVVVDVGNIDPCLNYETKSQIEVCQLKNKVCNDDSCFLEKAQTFSNESSCFDLDDEISRVGCSVVISESKIIERSIVENDISICLEFEEESRIFGCYDNFYLATRMNSGNKESCSKIANEVLRNECFS